MAPPKSPSDLPGWLPTIQFILFEDGRRPVPPLAGRLSRFGALNVLSKGQGARR